MTIFSFTGVIMILRPKKMFITDPGVDELNNLGY